MLSSFLFQHIGMATDNIHNTAQYYVDAGYRMSDIVYEPTQDVYITFLEKESMPKIELVMPGSDNSPVCKIIKKSGVTPYHLCYGVKNIDTSIKELKEKHFLPLSCPICAVTMEDKKIAFLFSKEVGLIELVEI
jgi:methylmalonyl-CoA/ethylmalonyl-CoA epimerase